jgi:hypothetical protein
MTMRDIAQSVGERQPNRADDIGTVNELLGNVPERDGGVADPIPLNPYGWDERMSVAIKKFQWRQFPIDPQTPTGEYGRVDPLGSRYRRTLQRLNEFAPPRTAAPYSAPTATRGMSGGSGPPLLFVAMWNLTHERVAAFPWHQLHAVGGYSSSRAGSAQSFVTTEILVSIFWEETAFRNIQGQIGNSGMWGFGQVHHRNIAGYNQRYGGIGMHFEDDWGFFAGYPARSIDLEIVALVEAWRMRGNERAALDLLGNPGLVPHWTRCRDILRSAHLGARLTVVQDDVGVVVRESLWAARHNVFNPDLAFPP